MLNEGMRMLVMRMPGAGMGVYAAMMLQAINRIASLLVANDTYRNAIREMDERMADTEFDDPESRSPVDPHDPAGVVHLGDPAGVDLEHLAVTGGELRPMTLAEKIRCGRVALLVEGNQELH